MNDVTHIHPWEKAGLGKAPFQWLGVEMKTGPIRIAQPDGVTLEVGAPGQPMGSCDFCGQGIAECHSIRSSDGKEFVVGCDCVRRVEAKGEKVRTQVERASLDLKNAAARKRSAAKAKAADARLLELISLPELRAKLSSRPSAYAWKRAEGETELNDVEWLANRCGTAGTLRLIKRLERELLVTNKEEAATS